VKKKTIAILGSTGSIGETTLEIIKKSNKFKVVLIIANKNYHKIVSQIKKFKPKIVIINNLKVYLKIRKKSFIKKTIILNNIINLDRHIKKIDITVSAIPGIAGLEPTISLTRLSKKILLANKESIVCGWRLIKKISKINKTELIPIDSEHFSIAQLTKNYSNNEIEKIYITASGGPFLNLQKEKFKYIKPAQAIKHPKWKMGKKISVDSATMMNKVFEIIEAKKIFDLKYEKLDILVHPSSYIHAITKFNDGMIKIVAHDTNMKIPIFNSLYENKQKKIKSDKLNLKKLNFLNFKKVDKNKFPSLKLIKKLQNKDSLLETVIVLANDELVNLFLLKKINFNDIFNILQKLINMKEFIKFTKIKPGNIENIISLNFYIRKKINKIIN